MDEGKTVELECRLVAIPEPDITWYYNGKEINSKDNITLTTDSDMHMYTSIVKITNVKKSQEGTYSILAKNREGEATISIPLKVKTGEKEPPTILEPLRSETVREGDTVILSTQIVGTPTPKVAWLKNGKPIPKQLPTRIDGDTYLLTIINPAPGDSGEFTVIAKNDHGSVQTSATLTVEGTIFYYKT